MNLFKKNNRNRKNIESDLSGSEGEVKDIFIADISMYEFKNIDWVEFGRLLKQNKILPNSYPKKPNGVDIKLNTDGKPMVLLTFYSATSDSVREFLLMQDEVKQSVNGVIKENENQELESLWNKFRNEIRYRSFLNTNRQGSFHAMKAERLMKVAKKIKDFDKMYELEQQFLKKYQNIYFDGFYKMGMYCSNKELRLFPNIIFVPAFHWVQKTEDNRLINGEPVVPFSPKTLEFCILHLTESEMIEEGQFLNDFEKKCRLIQEYSCYESEDWDKVIEFGKRVIESKYNENFNEYEG